MWTGCGQQAVYTTRKHGGLADWAITEVEALLDPLSLSFSFQRLNLSFSETCSTHTVLGLHTCVGNVWAIDSTMVDSTRMIETPVDSTINQESTGK